MSPRKPQASVDPEWGNLFRREITREESLQESLRHIPSFSLLDEDELGMLARIVYIRRFEAGETIVRRGVEQSGCYLIRSGSVDKVRYGAVEKREVVGTLGVNEILGEFALLDSTPLDLSLVAAEPSELIGFFRLDLMKILKTHPSIGCKILLRLTEDMTRRLQSDYAELRALGCRFLEEPPASSSPADSSPPAWTKEKFPFLARLFRRNI
jgi:CRP-like cAMP-binding protein